MKSLEKTLSSEGIGELLWGIHGRWGRRAHFSLPFRWYLIVPEPYIEN